ncbi:putative RING-H2 finger protein ATL69 [Selaginella moellendorffii]|uniref:putative RING-H2 finger protein ATL69 n=1 Tax=Selaginella moellendorffii TaxID=88036 RepID=UPI000D1CCED0|nr:putative RING-H2 finger protein ATL69 [Selaginella moellendorffii]|eukprot:XP_024521685.1 putative RING-H2 finger protein ATL69 [Selaginella moellendorffii]
MVNNGTSADFTNPSMSRVGLGYGIAIAVGILVLVSTIMLASYVCVRVHGRAQLNRAAAAAAAAAQRQQQQQSSSRDRSDGEWTISGLDQVTLESYPRIVFSAQQPLPHPQDTACAICLADYREAEMLRVLPDCRHVFHVQCIDSWMRLQATCPMCRTSPLPTPQATPISTPLSELIPLARHPR